MKKITVVLCWAILAASLPGCDHEKDEPTHIVKPVPNPVIVKTNKDAYIRNESPVITITNNSEIPIRLGICESNIFYYRDKLVNDQWITWTQLTCFTEDLDDYFLQPGTEISDTVMVSKPGTYHFWYIYSRLDESGKRDTIHSNTFTIY